MPQNTLTADELRQKPQTAKATYKGDDPEDFAKSLERTLDSLRTRHGDRVPAVDAFAVAVFYAAGLGAASTFGEVRITRDGDDGAIFTGIGSLGRMKHIHWSDFRGAAAAAVSVYAGARFTRTRRYVALTGASKRVGFGANLSDDQLAFIAYVREQLFGKAISNLP